MGFTRFWKQPHGINPDAFREIVADTAKLLATVTIPLAGAAGRAGQEGLPLFADDEIAFNGRDAESAEWFVLRPTRSDFECVKTYGRPYDVVVAAVLIIAKHHAPSEILNVTSDDDDWNAWKLALETCTAAGVKISKQSVERLRTDVERESEEYEPPKSTAELELDAEWKRMYEDGLLKAFCEECFPPTYLRYQAAVRVGPPEVKLHLRRSIDARSLPPTSPVLQRKVHELQTRWNETHRIKIVEIEIG